MDVQHARPSAFHRTRRLKTARSVFGGQNMHLLGLPPMCIAQIYAIPLERQRNQVLDREDRSDCMG